MLVRELRKWRRVYNLAVERHQKKKERNWGNGGFRRKLAAACRKVFHHAKVAWRKRNHQECSDPKKLWTAEDIDCHRHKDDPLCKVARREECNHEGLSVEQRRGKNKAENKFTIGTRKGCISGKRRRVDLEGSTGVKDPNTRQHRQLKNEKTAGLIFQKTFRLQMAK
jgi:hypothetical protein